MYDHLCAFTVKSENRTYIAVLAKYTVFQILLGMSKRQQQTSNQFFAARANMEVHNLWHNNVAAMEAEARATKNGF